MSMRCQITGKKRSSGHNVSHSNRHTKRTFKPNLIKTTVWNRKTGKFERMRVSTQALRLIKKQLMGA